MSNTQFSNPVTSSGIGGPSPSSEKVKGGVGTGNSPATTTHGHSPDTDKPAIASTDEKK